MRLLGSEDERRQMASAPSPYGDGHASEKIADILTAQLCSGEAAG
jgi:UDP-N-acetylglucosamine 2-epimerase